MGDPGAGGGVAGGGGRQSSTSLRPGDVDTLQYAGRRSDLLKVREEDVPLEFDHAPLLVIEATYPVSRKRIAL